MSPDGENAEEGRAPGGQGETPYLDALLAYSARGPARLHVPGHKGGSGADPGLVAALGLDALRLDIPALTWGIDVGKAPTPFDRAQELAAAAWGARRTWFLISGASQGNLAAALTLVPTRCAWGSTSGGSRRADTRWRGCCGRSTTSTWSCTGRT
ncbi:MAG: hypothetical protein LC720_03960 [Actinobacteria bacterium]|nr:hypothetical protein [Actinomycetota bacterium]